MALCAISMMTFQVSWAKEPSSASDLFKKSKVERVPITAPSPWFSMGEVQQGEVQWSVSAKGPWKDLDSRPAAGKLWFRIRMYDDHSGKKYGPLVLRKEKDTLRFALTRWRDGLSRVHVYSPTVQYSRPVAVELTTGSYQVSLGGKATKGLLKIRR